MEALVIDLTHGGINISIELSKLGFKVFAYDFYKTLKKNDINQLESYNVKIIKDLDEFKSISKYEDYKEKFYIIYPVHCPISKEEIAGKNIKKFIFLNHHETVKMILKQWNNEREKLDIPLVEVTGVKGKTSTVFILKEIMNLNRSLLILSSLGAFLFKDDKKIILKNNLSITPANIIETIKISRSIINPKCNIVPSEKFSKNEDYEFNYESVIWESSLGVTGLGDIGILTNLIENYPIAKNTSTAREAKKQVFNCKIVVIEEETLKKYYPKEAKEYEYKINSFSINSKNSNASVRVHSIEYSLDITTINIEYNNLKTINGNILNGKMNVKTFAPGKHNVLNILSAITASLSLNIKSEIISKGLTNFKGIDGRTSKRIINNQVVFEEINPGLNVKAINCSMNMIKNLDNYTVIIGGKYGVTCEEINEKELIQLLEEKIYSDKIDLIFTDELGFNLKKQMKTEIPYYKNYNDAIKFSIKNKHNILFIYKSKYSDISKR